MRGPHPRNYEAELLDERPNSSDPVHEIDGQRDGIRLHEPEGEVIRATGGSVFAEADIPFAINGPTGHPLEGPIERVSEGRR